jgi:hypothetical protein
MIFQLFSGIRLALSFQMTDSSWRGFLFLQKNLPSSGRHLKRPEQMSLTNQLTFGSLKVGPFCVKLMLLLQLTKRFRPNKYCLHGVPGAYWVRIIGHQ